MPTIQEKKEFITWLLKSHQALRRESVWILNYLTSNDKLLKQIHFTDDARSKDLGLVIGFEGAGLPFRFYMGSIMSADAEKAFHKMRTLTEWEKLYIEVNFKDKHKSIQYLGIVEGDTKTEVSPRELNSVMDSIKQMNKERYINEALDSNNKELFMQLTGGQQS